MLRWVRVDRLSKGREVDEANGGRDVVGRGLRRVDRPTNALPQALILTAIVIGFGLLAFTLVLVYRARQALGTVDSDAMRIAESDESLAPPSPCRGGKIES